MAAPTTTTKDRPPQRDVLNAQIASAADAGNQIKVAEKLQRISGYLDDVIALTGLPLTLALAPYTPQVPAYPFTLRRVTGNRVETARVTDLDTENFYRAQGYG